MHPKSSVEPGDTMLVSGRWAALAMGLATRLFEAPKMPSTRSLQVRRGLERATVPPVGTAWVFSRSGADPAWRKTHAGRCARL